MWRYRWPTVARERTGVLLERRPGWLQRPEYDGSAAVLFSVPDRRYRQLVLRIGR